MKWFKKKKCKEVSWVYLWDQLDKAREEQHKCTLKILEIKLELLKEAKKLLESSQEKTGGV